MSLNFDDYRNTKTYSSAKEDREMWEAYRAEENRLHDLFYADFCAELGIVGHPKADALFEKAWEHGHSSGYSEVMQYGYDLVGLIR